MVTGLLCISMFAVAPFCNFFRTLCKHLCQCKKRKNSATVVYEENILRLCVSIDGNLRREWHDLMDKNNRWNSE